MKCPKCNLDNLDDSKFCKECGTNITASDDAQPQFTKTLETPFPQLSKGITLADRYEILDELGKGGMGEVYLAEDTNLKRQVAIKVLPQQFALDKERLARFEREARLLASLNHPNVATIHGLERSDDQQFLVMELVEGETLRDKISKGQLPVDEALQISKQIAEGLESAHEKGIIHRDLKPANVKVSPAGKVKILDFGIAKALQDVPDDTNLSQSPPITDEMTQPGVILGTAAYMSPEQAKGKRVDKRSDIWAFGCILYECLVGKRIFKGDTISEIVASILKDEPSWKDLPDQTPVKIRELIGRCLMKDPHDRLHDVADARIIIHETIAGTDELIIHAEPERKKPLPIRYLPPILFGLVAGILLMTLIPLRRAFDESVTTPKEIQRFELISEKAIGSRPVISPDGSRVIFRDGEEPWALRQRVIGQRQATQIPGTESAGGAFFSPDGQWIGFFQDSKLKKLNLSSGDIQTLCDADNPFGAAWGLDGTIVFVPHITKGLWRVAESGGEPQRLTVRNFDEMEWAHIFPVFLPDGSGVLFAIWYGGLRHNVALLDLNDGTYKTILKNASYAVHTQSGHLVFARSDGLYAVGFDLKNKAIIGDEVPLIRDIFVGGHLHGLFTISQTGTLSYLEGEPRLYELVSVDLQGNATPLPTPIRYYRTPRFSPDGNEIAVNIIDKGEIGYWIVDPKTGRMAKLASDGQDLPPIWSNDGEYLVYQSDRSGLGQWKTYLHSTAGGEAELLIDPVKLKIFYFSPFSWSPDTEFILGSGRLELIDRPNPGSALMYWSIKESKFTTLMERREQIERYDVQISPDGNWLVYGEWERFPGGQPMQVYVTRFPEGGERYKVSTDWGNHPIWSPEGRQIYFRHGGNLEVVDVQTEPEFRASSPRVLFNWGEKNFSRGTFYPFPNWDISPDGKSFIMLRNDDDWEPQRHINITTNFFEELKQKVPTEK